MIYLDNNATTVLDPKVLEAMLIDLKGGPSNPSSNHFLGKKAKNLLLMAKRKIASYLLVEPSEIIFTSGGTESLNFLIKGFLKGKKGHLITTDIEHACVYNTVLDLEKEGYSTTFIKTGAYGAAKPSQIEEKIKEDTKLIVLSAVNSETGVITDIEAIAKIAHKYNIAFIIDGVALLGKKRFSLTQGISAMGFSAHKIHGPKGIGFVYLNKKWTLSPFLLGGNQENNLRAGTENLAGILGLTEALAIAYDNLDENLKKITKLKQSLEEGCKKNLKIQINGEGPRICNTSNISFLGIDAEDLLMHLDLNKIAASHGSACSSNTTTLSRILLNMGLSKERVKSALRFSLSKLNTPEEIEKTIDIIIKIIKKLI